MRIKITKIMFSKIWLTFQRFFSRSESIYLSIKRLYCNINLHSIFKYCEELSSTTWRQRRHNEEVAALFMFAAKYWQGKYSMAKRALRVS
jgi:hypothetical protein